MGEARAHLPTQAGEAVRRRSVLRDGLSPGGRITWGTNHSEEEADSNEPTPARTQFLGRPIREDRSTGIVRLITACGNCV
jgi:hypothetical protein